MSGDLQKEKDRTCPSCRSSISVLATKCRFCGESVGKPKDEVRQLSAEDMGGESVKHTASSASVVEAMDSMRQVSGTGQTFDSLPKVSLDDDMILGGGGITESGNTAQSAVPSPNVDDKANGKSKIVFGIVVVVIALLAIIAIKIIS